MLKTYPQQILTGSLTNPIQIARGNFFLLLSKEATLWLVLHVETLNFQKEDLNCPVTFTCVCMHVNFTRVNKIEAKFSVELKREVE